MSEAQAGFDARRFFELARTVGHGRALGLDFRGEHLRGLDVRRDLDTRAGALPLARFLRRGDRRQAERREAERQEKAAHPRHSP